MKKRRVVLMLVFCLFLSMLEGNVLSEVGELIDITGMKYAQVFVPNGSLNLRRRASTSSPVIDRIPNGTIIMVEEEGLDWCRVSYKDREGYVVSEFLGFMYELPFEQLSRDDRGRDVLKLKKRMQELGYFNSGAENLSDVFSMTTEDRLRTLQSVNRLEVTGVATPELQAFIFWGPAKKNGSALSPLPVYFAENIKIDPSEFPFEIPGMPVASSNTPAPADVPSEIPGALPTAANTPAPTGVPVPTPQTTGSAAGLSVQISELLTGEDEEITTSSGLTYARTVTYKYTISGGEAPYIIEYGISGQLPEISEIDNDIRDNGIGKFRLHFTSSPEGKPFTLTLSVTDRDGTGTTVSATRSGTF